MTPRKMKLLRPPQAPLLCLLTMCCATTAVLAQIPTDAWPLKEPVIPDTVEVIRGIAYAPYPATMLDVMRPKEPAGELRPGVIVIHGGGWVGGNRSWVAELVCLRYIQKGFVVANVEYRMAKAAPAPGAVEDAIAAARWFVSHAAEYGVDPNRIVTTGDSAGSHLALMVALAPKEAGFGDPPRIRAVVNFFGIADVEDLVTGANPRDYATQWVPEQPGRAALAKRVSPLHYVRPGAPAVLTIHGSNDPLVPYAQAVQLNNALVQAGGVALLITVAGGAHGFPRLITDEIYQRYVWRFLESVGVFDPARQGFAPRFSCAPSPKCEEVFRK